MKAPKRAKSFFVVVRDHDRKVFSVHGPMNDDDLMKDLVLGARAAGRIIDHVTVGVSSIESVTKKAARDTGYAETGNACSAD